MYGGGWDWLGYMPLALALVLGAIILFRRLTKADEADMKARIEAQGGATVVWVKRLDTQKGGDSLFNRYGQTTCYDVLVERDGARRIEVWRDGGEGVSRDH